MVIYIYSKFKDIMVEKNSKTKKHVKMYKNIVNHFVYEHIIKWFQETTR